MVDLRRPELIERDVLKKRVEEMEKEIGSLKEELKKKDAILECYKADLEEETKRRRDAEVKLKIEREMQVMNNTTSANSRATIVSSSAATENSAHIGPVEMDKSSVAPAPNLSIPGTAFGNSRKDLRFSPNEMKRDEQCERDKQAPSGNQEERVKEVAMSDSALKASSKSEEKRPKPYGKPVGQPPKPGYQCKYCRKRFYTKVDLESHIKLVHPTKKPFKCTVCNKKMNTEGSLKIHVKSHLNLALAKVKCQICGGMYRDKQCCTRHQQLVHWRELCQQNGVTPVKCEVCGRWFYNRSILKRHTERTLHARRGTSDGTVPARNSN